ncbi:MAG: hypothetical protein NVS4B8_24840 [Herpetosiphon sp.]
MATHARKLTVTHELDAAWIIALWKAIHGGDPSPIEVDARSVELVSELVNHLSHTVAPGTKALTRETFEPHLRDLGIHVERPAATAKTAEAQSHTSSALHNPGEPQPRPRPYCFVFKGKSYCVEFPRPLFTAE